MAGDIFLSVGEDGTPTFTDTPDGTEPFSLFLRDLSDRPQHWAPINESLLRRNIDLYDPIILRMATAERLPPELIKAVILVESGFAPEIVSHAGAVGLMQLMPPTARELGVTDSRDPMQNIRGGAHYLRRMSDRFGGNLRLTLAAYNAGPGNVERYNGVPPFEETQYYVQKVLRYYQYFSSVRPVGVRNPD